MSATFRSTAGGSAWNVVDYAYDPFNQLVQRENEFYIHDQGQVVLQFAGSVTDNLSHRYLWGAAVDQLFADEQVDYGAEPHFDGEVLWTLGDNLGSVRDVLDSNGDLRVHRNFDAFGNVIGETHLDTSGDEVTSENTGYIDEAFAYTGRLFDKATGLQNNLNRWYDPKIGRWMSEDPLGLGPDVNPDRYVGNSATNYVDPDGLKYRGSWQELWGTIYYLPSAVWHNGWDLEQSQTLAAYVDGVIPFGDPLSNHGLYDPCDKMFQQSRLIGNVARDVGFAIYTFGNSTWSELGNTTVPKEIWQTWEALGITGDAAAKAAWLTEHYGFWGRFLALTAPGQFITTTLTTGPNIGGGLGANAAVQFFDWLWFRPKCP